MKNWCSLYGDHLVYCVNGEDPREPLSYGRIYPNGYLTRKENIKFSYKVIHGHFHPFRFSYIQDAFRLVFLRHPLDNLISMYFFLKGRPAYSFFSKFLKDNCPSFDSFIRVPTLRYLYTRVYFQDYDMSLLNFVGDYSNYTEELIRLGSVLGVTFDLSIRDNVTCPQYSLERSKLMREANMNLEYTHLLEDDIAFYMTYKGK